LKYNQRLNRKTKIFIVEDHPVYRMGLKELILQENDMNVCGDAEDADTAWRLIRKSEPDIIIIDLILKHSNGIDLIKDIKKAMPVVPILVISMMDEMQYAERAFAAGASGYIMKHEASNLIVEAIRSMMAGKRYMSEDVNNAIVEKAIGRGSADKISGVESLTDRELEIFRLVGSGCATGTIARQLRINVKTVGTYRERIKQKLGIKSSASLVREAMNWVSSNSGKEVV
jgi:DNA-binding NarL/FixJ family response regulator